MVPPLDTIRFEQLKASGDLPSPKGVALAIIQMTQQDDVSMADLARLIRQDPAFVGRLIKAANGLIALNRRPVASVQEALMVLGLPAVRTMALGFSLLSNYRRGRCRHFDYSRYWSASLGFALAARAIAKRTRVAAPDEMFSLGLLARIGELALATLFSGQYDAVLVKAQGETRARLREFEQDAFAMTHSQLTRAMLEDWRLPRLFAESAGRFEAIAPTDLIESSRESTMMYVLATAWAISEALVADEPDRVATMGQVLASGARLGFGRDPLVELCEGVAAEWEDWGSLLELGHGRAPAFGKLVPQDASPLLGTEGVAPGGAGDATEPAADGGEPIPTPAIKRVRALIVDDEQPVRQFLVEMLEGEGHQVFEAENGVSGLELALEIEPELMVLDADMPGMSGLELMRALRATRLGRSVYILLITQHEDEEHLVDAFEAGADDFVGKPVKPRVLAARLQGGLRVVRLQRELEREREELRHFAAELAVSNRRLQEAALTDALTGFPNRRYAIDRIQREWTASVRNGRPLSCMVIDIDDFKRVNDTHGHDVGDAVLQKISNALRGALRGQDVVCRTGGDEFLVICPDTDVDAATACAERLRAAVEALRLQAGGDTVCLSLSIGVALREPGMADVDALVKRADMGAYRAKQMGRNRVVAVQ